MTRRRIAEDWASDDRGAVTTDWITLSAGIILLGMMVVFSVMNNSAGYLMDEFEDLNNRFSQDSQGIRVSSAEETSAAAANAAAALDAAQSIGGFNAASSEIGGGSTTEAAAIEIEERTAEEPAIRIRDASAAARDAASSAAIQNRSTSAQPSESARPGASVPLD